MSSVNNNNNNSVDTVTAAATAIVSAESRPQPAAVVQKRRWGSCWSLYWCFGSHKSSKRISHAVLVPEPVETGAAAPVAENLIHSTAIVLPFIAPPSSPASFLQSDPPSATQSPAGLLSLTSLSINAYSPGGPRSIFAIGPYAHETQLVTPPAFSAFTTGPSTALCTPPPESVQLTTPSSPEVPFAELLTSSLERARQNSGTNQKFSLSHYEFQSYQLYPGSPGGQLISPGSAISNSGTSSPFPDRWPIIEFYMGEAPKGFEHFTTQKWGSRLGSGSLTPDGVGLGSRLGSGSLTPDGVGLGSRLGSGSLTPDGVGPASQDGFLLENQISEVVSSANLEKKSKNEEHIIDHRVSFELSGEEVARCLANISVSSPRIISECPSDIVAECQIPREGKLKDSDNSFELYSADTSNEIPEKTLGELEEEHFFRKHRSITLGSIKEFNFDNTEGEVSDKPLISSEWWANEKVDGKESTPSNNWTFFPVLQSEVS
ncbi:uncharacterized protein LOC123198118 [Mangifera indica]|uniref:uncharacterized protein LOC123198118 n=1 Tax=Mangifera indica TaxID=29780 RepID=UPI001CFBE067|nr:uncharacterized protein LOC123198118 [Mangifera indica]XP_044468666.1 uncharacterized protein LOC123198118 [Mangifera indica]XP_044468667.1 uncharacterized protein LOC123198118 [Mangifera indica]